MSEQIFDKLVELVVFMKMVQAMQGTSSAASGIENVAEELGKLIDTLSGLVKVQTEKIDELISSIRELRVDIEPIANALSGAVITYAWGYKTIPVPGTVSVAVSLYTFGAESKFGADIGVGIETSSVSTSFGADTSVSFIESSTQAT